jgi:hypothetical protein
MGLRADQILNPSCPCAIREHLAIDKRRRNVEVFCKYALEDAPEIGRRLQIAAFVEITVGETRPVCNDAAAVDRAAGEDGSGCGAVVGTACAVDAHRSTELGRNRDNPLAPGIAQTVAKPGDAGVKRREPIDKLAAGRRRRRSTIP